jgi:hypothetical protein
VDASLWRRARPISREMLENFQMKPLLTRELGNVAVSLRDLLEAIEERIDQHRTPLPDGRRADPQTLYVLQDVAERAEYLITALETAERHAVTFVYKH